jgi:macrolide-specific efflux system membrane fusion protein
VDVAPKSTPDFMRSGMTANVNFAVSSRENVLAIPVSTIDITELGPTVLVRNENGKKVPKAIKTGLSDGKMIEVVEGLSEGEIVLLKQLSDEGGLKSVNPLSPMGRGKRR